MRMRIIINLVVYSEVFCCISEVKIGVSFDTKVEGEEWPCVLKSVCPYLVFALTQVLFVSRCFCLSIFEQWAQS